MSIQALTFSFFRWHLLLIILMACGRNNINVGAITGGKWDLLQSNTGISAMHMQLLHNDKVILLDRTDYGFSNISLPNGQCRNDPNELVVKVDCTAHSVEYDVLANTVRPLMVLTNTWCSSGSVMPDGTLAQTGGFNDGDRALRLFTPCSSGCDWKEINNFFFQRRWYATNQILSDGRIIIVGGTWQFDYEFYPKTAADTQAIYLPFLQQTHDGGIENNLYPFIFLNPDGNLFIFANNQSILFDYTKNAVIKTFPSIPGGDPRNYPSTGSAALLPLKSLKGAATATEVIVCGGAPHASYNNAVSGIFTVALNTCGRLRISDKNPMWKMETMPMPRVMGDMVLLPNGNILIINGAANGIAGWDLGRNPVLNPLIYKPDNSVNSRFEIQNPSTIPRMYHSTAGLLRDGRVLVAGSNPHEGYDFSGVLFPTELRLEAFSPSYLDASSDNLRPKIISPTSQSEIKYGQILTVQFTVSGLIQQKLVTVTMVAPPFTTHSFSQNQRLLVLGGGNFKKLQNSTYQVGVMTPTTGNLAPSGYYLLFVVHQDIPSQGIWVHIQ